MLYKVQGCENGKKLDWLLVMSPCVLILIILVSKSVEETGKASHFSQCDQNSTNMHVMTGIFAEKVPCTLKIQSPSPNTHFITKLKTSKTMSGCVAQGEADHDFLIIEQISYLVLVQYSSFHKQM